MIRLGVGFWSVTLNTVLEMGEFMSQSAVRESLFAELKDAVTHGPGEIKLLRLEAFKKLLVRRARHGDDPPGSSRTRAHPS